jgi:hypothetical protein
MLSPAKVGMGIAFTDLSPHTVAELRDVVDGSDEKAQLVRLRFAGKNQLVCTRALPTAEGFQFTTALPFLRSDNEVEISLSPEANLTTKGWVSSVALGPAQEDGIPRLVIDIRAGESAAPRLAPDAAVSGEVESPVASPHVGALPERVWQPWDLKAANDASSDPTGEASGEVSDDVATELSQVDLLEEGEADGTPVRRDPDKTEIVRFSDLERPRGARAGRARTMALTASAVAVAAVAVVAVRIRPPRAAARSVAVIVSMPTAPPIAPAGSVAPVAPVAAATPPIAEPPPSVAPIVKPIVQPTQAETEEPIAEPTTAAGEPDAEDASPDSTKEFAVALVGSLKGAHKYALHTPDGVAFNLPNAKATMKVGTYRPAVKGLRAVWVRDLPGGGTHLRFFYAKSRPAPEVRLHTDGVRVVAR